ncbi:MAG: transposase [Candidatus Brocadiae bacterium]|nr:transposase [Candidatus Brocadiia bacterium]
MPRTARIVLPGFLHHVSQRGNNRQEVFFTPGDRRKYLDLLRQQCDKHGLAVSGYCLMTNHVHLVVTPPTEQSLAKAIGRAHFLYTRHLNRLHRRSGHLWQNRYYSCAVDEDHILAVMSYIERNPVRAGLVAHAWEYEWSSASAHTGRPDRGGLLDLNTWRQTMEPETWQQMLTAPRGEAELERVRTRTRSGRPLVGDSLLGKLEASLGRRLRPGRRGRPRTQK